MEKECPYKILNITEKASKEEVMKAYRKKYIALYPNKGLSKKDTIYNNKLTEAYNEILDKY
jgi:curved DNA-binding protein CbpA